ncbi:uncharacterized protein LOC126745329 [Anthonomus grandis grandis]|uniref:uncharacterized protein LOC126745329 n=1 Tax=Anthonomus grandis grandis TaxID=2921223 RepID=UPI00216618DD|nr:uncharacterized protein LOC126745329 [Anthonomus grandis grandis]
MILKVLICGLLIGSLLEIHAISVNKINLTKDSSEEKTSNKEILESLKQFVQLVETLKLNVTVVGSYAKENKNYLEETLSLSMHLPRNQDGVTQPTLDDGKQDKFLKKIEMLSGKELVGARTRVVRVNRNGSEEELASDIVNPQYYINAMGVEKLTPITFESAQLKNDAFVYLRNYVINTPGPDNIQNVRVILGSVKVTTKEMTRDFPKDMQKEIETMLPLFWMMFNDYIDIAKALGTHLDNFQDNVQVMIGTGEESNFATGAKTYATFNVGDKFNVLVFMF